MTNLSNLYTNINNLVKGYEKQVGSDGSSNTVFTLTNAYVMGNNTLMVFVNGQKVEKVTSASDTTEYEETNNYTITFGSALQDSDVIEFYIVAPYNLSQDNFDTMMDSYQTSVGGLAGFKNKIINGNFDIWQRGTSFVAVVSNAYTADRFRYNKSGTMVHTITQDTDVPTVTQSEHKSNYSIKTDCTTADATIAAGDYTWLQYRVEGYDFAAMVGKICTFSFWVKATKTGTYCLTLNSSSNDRSYIAEYTISSSNTWEKKEITLTFDYTGGTWDYTNGNGLKINFVLACGSTFHGTKDSWLSGEYFATSSQVNACDNVANNFWLSQVQLEVGSSATPFENRSIQQELAMCQRYYYRFTEGPLGIGSAVNSTIVRVERFHPVQMRVNPTVSASSGAIVRVDNNSIKTLNYQTTAANTVQGCLLSFDTPVNFTPAVNKSNILDFGLSGTQWVDFDAEL